MPKLPLVREYMDHFVNTLRPETDIFDAVDFLRGSFRRLPVVEDGQLVGAITRFDILRAIKARLRPETDKALHL